MGRFPGPIACGAMHHLCSASATAWSISHFVEDTLVSVADAAAMLTDLVLMPGCTPRPGAGAEKVGVAQMPQLNPLFRELVGEWSDRARESSEFDSRQASSTWAGGFLCK